MAGESRESRKGFARGSRAAALNGLGGEDRSGTPADRAAERTLVAAARAGDRKALDRVVRRLSDAAYRFGRGFCRDPHDAEDVSQDVLTALVTSLPKFRGEASLSTWAWIVARRACARRRRHSGRTASLDAGDEGARELPDPLAGPERDAERRELGAALERAIAALPAAQRDVLVLRDVEGLPAARVARLLGLQVRAVKSRLHRARLALRDALAPHVGGAEAPRHPGCPETALLLSRHLEGELSGDLCARLEEHVRACPDCAAQCAALREVLGSCRRWGSAPAPRALRTRLKAMMRGV